MLESGECDIVLCRLYSIVSVGFFLKCRGSTFRTLYSQVGELRSLIPSHTQMMALTATATRTLRCDVFTLLGMRNYSLIECSPEKSNIS